MDKARRFEIMGHRHGLQVINAELNTIRHDEMEVRADMKYTGTFSDDLQKSRRAVNALTGASDLIYKAIEKLDNIP